MVDLSRINKALRQTQSEVRVQRMWHNIDRNQGAARKVISRFTLIPAAAVLGLMVLVLIIFQHDTSGPLQLLENGKLPGVFELSEVEKSYRFLDGSVVKVFARSRLEVLENSHSNIIFALRKGGVHFDIRPQKSQAWYIHCAEIEVKVIGTSFKIEREDVFIRVEVYRGLVLVSGPNVPDNVQRILAGNAIIVPLSKEKKRAIEKPSCPDFTGSLPTSGVIGDASPNNSDLKQPFLGLDKRFQSKFFGKNAPSKGMPGKIVSEKRSRISNKSTPNPSDSLPDRKKIHTHKDKRRAGLPIPQSLPNGVHDQENDFTIENLFTMADRARLSGHSEDAVKPLQTIITTYPADSRSGLAAFTLAQIQLDTLSSPLDAAQNFKRSLSLGLPPALQELAFKRRAEALFRAKDPDFTPTANHYLSRYPQGRYRNQVEKWLKSREKGFDQND